MECQNFTSAPGAKKLISFLKKDSVFVLFVKMAVNEGLIRIPSLYSDRQASCKASVYMGINCLYFEEDGTGKPFYLIQDNGRAFPFAAYSPVDHVGYLAAKPEARYLDLFKRLDRARPIQGPFHGLINFYNRPYHYFVDRAPFLFDAGLEGTSVDLFTARDNAFLDFETGFLPGLHQVILSDATEFINRINSGGIYIEPMRSNSRLYNESVLQRFFSSVCNKNNHKLPDSLVKRYKNYPVLWLGLSAEKRKYVEAEALYKRIISTMEASFDSYTLIFDGLTSGVQGDKLKTREASAFELSVVQNLRSHILNGEVVDLIGANSEEKIQHAKHVDFFITNFLTDSIWLSYFNKKRGIGFGVKGGKPSFENPEMIVVDSSMVMNVTQGETNLSRISFSINPDYLYDIFQKNFILEFSEKTSQ